MIHLIEASVINLHSTPDYFLGCFEAFDEGINATESLRPLFFLAASGLMQVFH